MKQRFESERCLRSKSGPKSVQHSTTWLSEREKFLYSLFSELSLPYNIFSLVHQTEIMEKDQGQSWTPALLATQAMPDGLAPPCPGAPADYNIWVYQGLQAQPAIHPGKTLETLICVMLSACFPLLLWCSSYFLSYSCPFSTCSGSLCAACVQFCSLNLSQTLSFMYSVQQPVYQYPQHQAQKV